ncbi:MULTISPECIES: hypothetical protein [unclassified Stenotrophomonas maltophilia group]|uniref:hypothetical protein n=1 Tax=unclassified Stenotrophomonas maltophilia group TaxID=2961925 RepID=UPI003BF827CB
MENYYLLEIKEKVAGFVPRLVDLEMDLPQMVFRGAGWRFRFFERPVLLDDDVMSNLIESSSRTFGSGIFVKFSRSSDLNSVLVIDNSCVGRAFDSAADAYEDNLMDLGYPVIFGDLEGRWIGFESVCEELGVLAVRDSIQAHEFISNLGEGLISVRDLQAWAVDGGDLEKAARAFLAAYND